MLSIIAYMYFLTLFRSIVLTCISALLYPTIALSAPPLAHWQQPDYIEQSFINIALNNEYDQRTHALRRWEQPVRAHLIYHVVKDPLYAKLTKMHLQHLAMITGHDIALEANEKNANMHIVFSTQAQWAADIQQYMGKQSLDHLNGAICMAHMTLGKGHAIRKAVVIIPVDQARQHRKLVTCIVEEITQVLGLPNDSDRVYPSIFNDHTPNDLLTGLDGLLLKLLYHPALKAGMRKQAVKPVIRQIIAMWSQDGTIANAEKNIHKGQLYPLLGY